MAEELVSTIPATAAPEHAPLWLSRVMLLLGCGIAVLTVFGCLGIFRELSFLWSIWTGDPLRSIGMLIPPTSVILTLRVWRQHGWEMRGTWWGLVVIGLAYFLSVLRQNLVLLAIVGGRPNAFLPVSLPVYVYASGIVLLFAGTRVWRDAWFPLGLLLLCQPIPGLSSGLIDIPLQNISARVARSFATFIGFTPTTPELRLMFSPNFGMFIAPGCDGIRGAVTLGYVALILGYLKRVSILRWIALVAGAVLLGYLFNFVRLCTLVIYYRIALGHPSMEGFAKQADYMIGSCLFLIATILFVWIARSQHAKPVWAEVAPVAKRPSPRVLNVSIQCAAFAVAVCSLLRCRPLRSEPAGRSSSTRSLSLLECRNRLVNSDLPEHGTNRRAVSQLFRALPTRRRDRTKSFLLSGLRQVLISTMRINAGWRAVCSLTLLPPGPSLPRGEKPSRLSQGFTTMESLTALWSMASALPHPARNLSNSHRVKGSAFCSSSPASMNFQVPALTRSPLWFGSIDSTRARRIPPPTAFLPMKPRNSSPVSTR